MTRLDSQVRKALIEQTSDGLVRCLYEIGKDPDYKSMITGMVDDIADTMISSMTPIFEGTSGDEIAEIKQGYREYLLSQFDNPELLRQGVYEQVKNAYMSVRQLRAKIGPILRDMRMDEEIGEDVVARYNEAYQGVIEVLRTNDMIVSRLAKIAETEGFDVSEEEEDQELKDIAKANNVPLAKVIDNLNKEGRREDLRNSILLKKTVDFLVKQAIIR